jgi:hypothetical protein
MTMMTLQRFKDLVEAYGAEPARWPEDERIAALELLERSAEARAAMEEAQALDRLLDLSPSTAVTPALQERILAALPPRSQSASGVGAFLVSLLPGRPAWVPAAALALSLALGLGVGTFAPTLAGLDDGAGDAALIALGGGLDDAAFWDQPGEGT